MHQSNKLRDTKGFVSFLARWPTLEGYEYQRNREKSENSLILEEIRIYVEKLNKTLDEKTLSSQIEPCSEMISNLSITN